MSDKWYEGLPDEALKKDDTAEIYEKALRHIREGLESGLDFDTACSSLDIADEALRHAVIDDMLKVLIAESHFGRNVPLEELAKTLKVSVERLETAKAEMFEDLKQASINGTFRNTYSGNA